MELLEILLAIALLLVLGLNLVPPTSAIISGSGNSDTAPNPTETSHSPH
jgi:hypothetical protein